MACRAYVRQLCLRRELVHARVRDTFLYMRASRSYVEKGFFPLFLLIKNSKFNYKQKFKNDYLYLIFFIIIFTPSLFFYYIAQDWGRWVSISYTLSLLTYVYSLKNNFVVLNFNRINYLIFRKKSLE